MDKNKYEDKFNIMIIGNEKVGKTAIIERFYKKTFLSERKQTIGIEHYDKSVKINNKDYLYKVWDTAGQEKFRVVARSFYQKAHGMILSFSVNNRDSFLNLRLWMNDLKENVDLEYIKIIIIANKIDLEEEREVSTEEIAQKANELGFEFFETSAKTGQGVDEAFDTIFKKVYESVYRKKSGFPLDDRIDGQSLSVNNCCKNK